jgi:Holliday junction resolvasome RuvABC endonuclease subunit
MDSYDRGPERRPAMTAKVLGIDLSLTSTGLAGPGWTATIEPANRTRIHRERDDKTNDARLRTAYNHQRLTAITSQLDDYLTGVDLVVMEGLAYDAHDTDRQLAGLSWIIRDRLWRRAIPYALVPPSTLKQFVTSNGAANKVLMRDLIDDWFDWFRGGFDEADAAGLMAMGYAHLGAPLGPLGEHQVTALGKVTWPETSVPPVRPVLSLDDPPAISPWGTHPQPGDPGHCGHELHGADGGPCPGCGWDSHPIPARPVPIADLGLPSAPPVAPYGTDRSLHDPVADVALPEAVA